jgi:hypothetical protein
MANITFRLPGNAQYCYAEVEFTAEEYFTPGPTTIIEQLQVVLADLNGAFPEAVPPSPAPAAASAPAAYIPPAFAAPAGGSGHACIHGERVYKTGKCAPSAKNPKGEWAGFMCPHKDRNVQCKPEWVNS